MNILLPTIRAKVSGRITMMGTRPDGSRRLIADFPNLITDQGLNRLGIGPIRNTCVVGTGSNAPDVADAQLQTTTARTNTGAPNIPGVTAQSTPPYYSQTYTGFRFPVGAAAGNLTEVGIGWETASGLMGYALWARALILDGLGSPTSVTVLSDEVLDVYYTIRLYPPLVDETYSINISGDSYDCISRAARVTSGGFWEAPSSRVLFTNFYSSNSYPRPSDGDIGAITADPSGVIYWGSCSISNNAYVNNSLIQDGVLSWGLDQGNLPGGIRSIFYQTGVGVYQTQFDPPIPKDNTKVLSVTFRVGWGRHAP